MLYADDLVVIAEIEGDLIKRLNKWKVNVENRGMRVNSGEWQKIMQKAVRWPFGICGRGIGNNSIQCSICQNWYTGNVLV